MDVSDINDKDRHSKHLYKREVDPLSPTYKLPSIMDVQRVIGPIEGARPRRNQNRQRMISTLNTAKDIPGAQP